jgi:thiamine transport system permease protein
MGAYRMHEASGAALVLLLIALFLFLLFDRWGRHAAV